MPDAHPNTVTLIVPATSADLRLARLIVSGVASLSDLDFDTIEDLRIAVDELSTLLLTEARDTGELMLEYQVHEASVEVRGTVDAAVGAGLPDVPELTRQILASVIDRYDVGAEDGQWSFSLTRSVWHRRRFVSERRRDDHIQDELAAFRRYQETGDRDLRNQIAESYRGLAIALARRFERRGEPLDDLIQVALLGILKAVQRFDPERGLPFATFATPTVLGELKRHFRDTTWSVKVPRDTKELHLRIGATLDELHADLGRAPTLRELAARLQVGEEQLIEALEAGAAYRPASLDAPVAAAQGGRTELSATIGASDPEMGRAEARLAVTRLLHTLPDRERTIVELRFFQDLTQSQIAEQIGISQMHVSRLLRQSLATLQARLRNDEADEDRPG